MISYFTVDAAEGARPASGQKAAKPKVVSGGKPAAGGKPARAEKTAKAVEAFDLDLAAEEVSDADFQRYAG